jgi:hypothetical protein
MDNQVWRPCGKGDRRGVFDVFVPSGISQAVVYMMTTSIVCRLAK